MVNCSFHLIFKATSAHITPLRSPLASNQQLDSIQNSSHLLLHCLLYNSSISLRFASSLISSSLSSLSLEYLIFHVHRLVRRTLGEEIRSIHWTCDLGLSSTLLSGICLHSPFKSERKTHLFSSACSCCFLIVPTDHQPWMDLVCV